MTASDPLGGTVTILLGDVEGSTRAWESDAGRASAAIKRLDDLAEKLIASHDGLRPVAQGEGDNVVGIFARATDALACALALQRELRLNEDGLALRVALHAGEVESRPDGKYGGPAFNRCARLRALAVGGQTLLSRPVYDLTADDLPDGLTLKDLGMHRLRDLSRSEHVFQLNHPDIPNEFPPLSTEVPNNLPAELTTFIGRESELDEVTALLDRDRLVTLTGAGGCGKTRLALRLASDVLDRYPDGVWWMDLAPISDSALVAPRLASIVSVQENADEPLLETLAHKLSGLRTLLVIDNCEHLITAAADLAARLLRGATSLTIVATSREPLGVEGEFSYRVPSLAIPGDGLTAEAAMAFDSVRLFVDRAARVRSSFRITDENAGAVVEICRGLDGIPLAIELAAARMRALNAQRVAARLTDRFRLLTGGDRSVLPRQRTLEASVDWSFGMLAERERTVLLRASVFVGTFDLDAAEAVCAGDPIEPHEVLDLISNLVDRSLVQFEDVGDEPRYGLLETIRAFARQRLVDGGEIELTRNKHLDHYLSLAERRDVDRSTAALVLRLQTETDNLRGAMDWAQSSGETEKLLRLAASAWPLWWDRGDWNEILRRLEVAVEATDVDVAVRARALYGAEVLCLYAGRLRDLRRYGALAAELFGLIGSDRRRGRALSWLGFAAPASGEAARRHAEESMRLAEETGDPVPQMALGTLGFLAAYAGRWSEADEHFVAAEEVARATFNTIGVYTSRFWRADLNARQRGYIREARDRFEKLLKFAHSIGNASPISFALMFLSRALVYGGDYERARALALEGIEIGRESGTVQGWIESLLSLGITEYAVGNLEEATECLARCSSSSYAVEFPDSVTEFEVWSARVALVRRDFDGARDHLEHARQAAAPIVQIHASWHPLVFARLARAEGDTSLADDLAHEALTLAAKCGVLVETVDALETVAGLAAHFESYEESARLCGAAQRLRDEIGYVRFRVEQPDYDADVARAREALGEEAFERPWAEGSAMSADEAVAYAERGRGERKRPSAGWEALTPTELDVVRLAAQGLSNPQIAERMFISRHTVKVHMSHVFAKLGVSSRAELAAEATRRAV